MIGDEFVVIWVLGVVALTVWGIVQQRRSGNWPPSRALMIGYGAMALGVAVLLISWATGLSRD